METSLIIWVVASAVALIVGWVITYNILKLRTVVDTNEIHIVQRRNTTVSYGKDTGNGNTYYAWPAWMPVIGITRSALPTNNFELELKNYEAYDKGRLPLTLDIVAFFRINDSNTAAQRVANTEGLKRQLTFIVQGAARAILASSDIEEIMQARATFGELFTKEVKCQLSAWGVEAVKNIELMDLRDAQGSKVIANIMEKKKSFIEMESRTEVANNKQRAEMAELEAQQQVAIKQQEVSQQVGMRKVEAEREVMLANQKKDQQVAESQKLTTEKTMEVKKVSAIKQAEIDKEAAIIKAEQSKQMTVIEADASLEAKRKESEGITLEGNAKADVNKALALAPVAAQVELATKITNDVNYQQYLISIKEIEAKRDIGLEQAKSLQKAEIKVIANAGNPSEGMNKVMDMFTASGGTNLAGMLEGLAQSEVGKQLLEKFTTPKK